MSTTSEAISTSQPPQPAPGKPIPLPSDFPVEWEDPADARMHWTFDPMHFPDPVLPLAFDFEWRIFTDGFNPATEAYQLPLRMHARRVNTYAYETFVPVGRPPAPVLKAMLALGRVAPGVVNALQSKAAGAVAQKYMDRLNPVMARLGDYWSQELLPEIKQHLATWERFDLRGATLPQLLDHLDKSVAMHRRVCEIHVLSGAPSFLAMSEFDELYRDLFGDDDAFGAYHLLEGFDNKILEGDRALWRLGRQALTLPAVRRVLEECAAADVMAELEKSAGGQAFLAALSDFLQAYGQRSEKFDDVGTPSWIEAPAPVIKNLKDYITQPDRDLDVELQALAAERERRAAEARERLKGYPRPVVERFESLLKAAQVGTFLHTERTFWTPSCWYQIRRVAQAFGRRLAEAGAIEQPDDVFYLYLDELKETARTLIRDAMHFGSASHLRTLVRERKAEMEHFRQVQPPPAIGSMPLGQPPDDPSGRTFRKFFGTPQPAAEPDILRGNAGSPGCVRGVAKVVRSLSEAGKLQPGDILVAETTAPPWTPLFATVAAVVTDTGGILSHCAVVAREYRIPAVVGTRTATARIHDGQMIEVDGDKGIVRLLNGHNP